MSRGAWYWDRRAKGLCVDCGAALPNGSANVRCADCGTDHRERQHRADWYDAVREQAAFEAKEKANLHDRIRKAAATNPTLTLEALSERFGYSVSYIARLIGGCSIERREANWSIPRSWVPREGRASFNFGKRSRG